MAGSYTNPPTPFQTTLPAPLTEGRSIVISGLSPPNDPIQKFGINLFCDKRTGPNGDVALHFNPRFNESCVVRNSKQAGNWGQEERHGAFPFQRGVPFEVVIHVTNAMYKVYVNGQPMCDFLHRLPLQRVDTFVVRGGIQINYVRFDGFPAVISHPSERPRFTGDSQPVFSPPTPFEKTLPAPLIEGRSIVISGLSPHSDPIQKFGINLFCDKRTGQNGDIALHFNPRFNESCVVRNSRQAGNWGQEERHGAFPFQRGVPFEVVIQVTNAMYKVYLNGQPMCDFKHRLPLQRVDTFVVRGGIQISYVRFDGFPANVPVSGGYPPMAGGPVGGALPPMYGGPAGGAYPPMHSGGHHHHPPAGVCQPPGVGFNVAGNNQPIFNPAVPFNSPVPGGVYPGKMIYVSGIPYPNCSRVTVNLQCDQSDSADIALHFDVRFNFKNNFNQIVRNSRKQGQWGQEETQIPHFPFSPNTNFDILILCEANCFKVAVNNQHLTEMTHRVKNLNRITTLSVKGDVRLTQVRFQ